MALLPRDRSLNRPASSRAVEVRDPDPIRRCGLLETRRKMHYISYGVVFVVDLTVKMAHQHLAGMGTNPDLSPLKAHLVPDLQGRGTGTLGVILAGHWYAEHCFDPSPRRLETKPPWRAMMVAISRSNGSRTEAACSGSRPLIIDVEPTISANRTVTRLRSSISGASS